MIDAERERIAAHRPIDIDQPATWAPALARLAHEHARRIIDAGSEAPDVQLAEAEQTFRSLVGDRGLIALHFTRLLDRERDEVRETSLQRLSPELVRRRIDRAYANAEITADER